MSSRIYLRCPALADQRAFLASVRKSHALHHPWTSAPATPAQFRAYLKYITAPSNCGYLICKRDSAQIVGVINITNIILGKFRSGYLGYYAFAAHARQGLMREGLQAVVHHAFTALKLHRLEANIQPGNSASIRLVRSCGFLQEGYSPRYLKISGRWRDHERWAIVAK